MDKISPYYAYYIKGASGCKSNSLIEIRIAAENLEKSLTFKRTKEAYDVLLSCYIKLGDDALFEEKMLEAANEGFTYFYSFCGIFYANNTNKYDKEKSLYWFSKALEAGEAKAFSDLSYFYINGCKAFGQNLEKAKDILLQGLSLNNPKWNGYFNWALGLMDYENKKYEEAVNYYKKAIDSGYMRASYYLALMYRDGFGVEKNRELYLENLLKYLDVQSALEIAGIYLIGEYAQQDTDIAFIYLNYAAKKGNPVGALFCAYIIIDRGNYNENQVNKYLEIAFKNSSKDANFKSNYDEIEKTFDEKARKKMQELISKYWETRKNEA